MFVFYFITDHTWSYCCMLECQVHQWSADHIYTVRNQQPMLWTTVECWMSNPQFTFNTQIKMVNNSRLDKTHLFCVPMTNSIDITDQWFEQEFPTSTLNELFSTTKFKGNCCKLTSEASFQSNSEISWPNHWTDFEIIFN